MSFGDRSSFDRRFGNAISVTYVEAFPWRLFQHQRSARLAPRLTGPIMLSRKELMYGKIAMLESIVKDMLIGGFLAAPNPDAAAEDYAERRKTLPQGFDVDPRFEIARQEVWNAFLDEVVVGVRRSRKKV
jgi:hypothetical protein